MPLRRSRSRPRRQLTSAEAVELRVVHRPESLPARTGVGCRDRAAKTDLVRFVLVEGQLSLDPQGRLPGRGAWLHPATACLELAERRRAFGRALHTQGPVDVAALRGELETYADQHTRR